MAGYENGIHLGALLWLLARLALALYLVATALAAYDARPLSIISIVIRLATAIAVLMRPEIIHFAAIGFAAALLFWHYQSARKAELA